MKALRSIGLFTFQNIIWIKQKQKNPFYYKELQNTLFTQAAAQDCNSNPWESSDEINANMFNILISRYQEGYRRGCSWRCLQNSGTSLHVLQKGNWRWGFFLDTSFWKNKNVNLKSKSYCFGLLKYRLISIVFNILKPSSVIYGMIHQSHTSTNQIHFIKS